MELELFNDERQLPPYAILSHTWGDSEVTLQQFRSLSVETEGANSHNRPHKRRRMTRSGSFESVTDRRKEPNIKQTSGYWKIAAACTQATADELDYVWCDTCCIDKSSSAELSEAINSMFRWYKFAQVCYAYLEDVEAHEIQHLATMDECDFGLISEEELAKAKWFTRGWTLQELIAPRVMKFYAKGWTYVGSKVGLMRQLARITGIDSYALESGSLNAFSIANRMSWAAQRQTTKIEDMAYCLLGIFDVNMPLLYGEGTKAFIRLQEEIMKDCDDQSLFAWLPSDTTDTTSSPQSSLCSNHSSTFNESWSGMSVFASHPSQFAHSSMIHPNWSSRGAPHALTNRGVRIELPIVPCTGDLARHLATEHANHCVIVLNCSYADRPGFQPGIVIQRHRMGSYNQFIRHPGMGLVRVSRKAARLTETKVVFLSKKASA